MSNGVSRAGTSSSVVMDDPDVGSSSQQHHRHHQYQQPPQGRQQRGARSMQQSQQRYQPSQGVPGSPSSFASPSTSASTSTSTSNAVASTSTAMASASSSLDQTEGMHSSYRPAQSTSASHSGATVPYHHRQVPNMYAHAEQLTTHLDQSFVPAVIPTLQEYEAKENVRVYLEGFVEKVEPGAKLLPFGSIANGFALKGSDMDLCCFLPPSAKSWTPAQLVRKVGEEIQKDTGYQVVMLEHARIPIIKLTIPGSAANPQGLSCDIGFENRLALENTRLLLTYAMIDERLRTLVLFLKVWSKRRDINNPYRGTLSSYGYVLLVLYFLMHVKSPPVLPNLQRLPLNRPIDFERMEREKYDIWFFDDLQRLPSVWQKGQNQEGVGKLLIDFFKHFAQDFSYETEVISIRSASGHILKNEKKWAEHGPEANAAPGRDLDKLCIEDPFQLDYNVARTVTQDGLDHIRDEFRRAYELLTSRPSVLASDLISELCEPRGKRAMPTPGISTPFAGPASPYQGQSFDQASPRRKSAPSPRMKPIPGGGGGGAFMPPDMLWPHANGAAGYYYPPTNGGYGSMPRQSPAYGNHRMSRSQRSQPGVSRAAGYQHAYGNATDSSPAHSAGQPSASLERRVSWDGSQQASIPTTTTGTVRTGATHRMTNVDLHRFFQNPPTSSDGGGCGDDNSNGMTSRPGDAPAATGPFLQQHQQFASTNHHHYHLPQQHHGPHQPPRHHLTAPSSPQSGLHHATLMPPFASGSGMMFSPSAPMALPSNAPFAPPSVGSSATSPLFGSAVASPTLSATSPLLTPPMPSSATFLPSPHGTPAYMNMPLGSTATTSTGATSAGSPGVINDASDVPPIDHSYLPQPIAFGSLPAGPNMIVPFSSNPSTLLQGSSKQGAQDIAPSSSTSPPEGSGPPRSSQPFRRGADGKESILFGQIAVELPAANDSDDEPQVDEQNTSNSSGGSTKRTRERETSHETVRSSSVSTASTGMTSALSSSPTAVPPTHQQQPVSSAPSGTAAAQNVVASVKLPSPTTTTKATPVRSPEMCPSPTNVKPASTTATPSGAAATRQSPVLSASQGPSQARPAGGQTQRQPRQPQHSYQQALLNGVRSPTTSTTTAASTTANRKGNGGSVTDGVSKMRIS